MNSLLSTTKIYDLGDSDIEGPMVTIPGGLLTEWLMAV